MLTVVRRVGAGGSTTRRPAAAMRMIPGQPSNALVTATTLPQTVATPDRYANRWLIAAGVTLASVMELIDTSIVNVALAQMSANLGATLDEIAWVSTGYILAAVIVLPMTGWLSSHFGRKRYFTGSIIIFTAASFFCGQASSLVSLVVWRIVQGLGGGALIATSQAILFESFPPEEQTTAAAVFGIGMMVGPAAGPTLGGLIVDRYSWPWIFYINIPVGILAAMMTWTYVKDSPSQRRARQIDVVGLALIAIGVGALQFMLERGEHYDWFDSGLIKTLFVTALVALATMVWWELRVPEPILDLRVLKHRSLAAGSLFAAVLGMALYGSIFALPIFIQQLLRYDAETAGWALFPGAIGSAIAMVFIARFAARIPDLRALIVVGSVGLIYAMILHSRFTAETGRPDMLWPVFLRGFATGCMFVPLATSAMSGLEGRVLAQGSAIFNLTRQLGGSIGIAVLATELARRAAIHRSVLVEHIVSGAPATEARIGLLTHGLIARGTDPSTAHQQAIGILDRVVQEQASVLAFGDLYRLVAVAVACSIPLIALLRKPPRGRVHAGE
jgi:DHA2 family multidrug resistance protein